MQPIERNLEISVYVTNLATYDGGWINLPVDTEELDAFLRDTVNVEPDAERAQERREAGEKVYEGYQITDMEFDKGAEAIGFEGVNVHTASLRSMNLLAAAVQYCGKAGNLDAVNLFMSEQSPSGRTPLAYANALLSSEDIAFQYYEPGYENKSEFWQFGATIFPDVPIDSIPQVVEEEDLAAYFDYREFGEDLVRGDYTVGTYGYLDWGTTWPPLPVPDIQHSLPGVLNVLEQQGLEFSGFPSSKELDDMLAKLEDAVGYRFSTEFESLSSAAPAIAALSAWVDQADDTSVEAVKMFMGEQGVHLTAVQYAAMASRSETIPYYEYDLRHADSFYQSNEEKLGETIVNNLGFPPDFEDYFDFGEYGESMSSNYCLGEIGFLDATDSGPDLGFFDLDDVAEIAGRVLHMDFGVSEPPARKSFAQKAQAATLASGHQEASRSQSERELTKDARTASDVDR